MFYPCEIIKTAIGSDNEILMKYVSENLNGVIPYKYQMNENRIVKTNGKIYESTNEDSSGLSGGIIAVIVIVPVAVVAIIVVTIYFVRKRKRIIEENERKSSENNENKVINFRNDNDDKSKE